MSEGSSPTNCQNSRSPRERPLANSLTVHTDAARSASVSLEGTRTASWAHPHDSDNQRVPSVLRAIPPSPTTPTISSRVPGSLTPSNLPQLTFDATRNFPVAPSGNELLSSFPTAPPAQASSVPMISAGQSHAIPASQVFRGEERSFLASAPSSPTQPSVSSGFPADSSASRSTQSSTTGESRQGRPN